MVTAFVTSTKSWTTSSPVSTGIGITFLALPSRYLSWPIRPTQPSHSSMNFAMSTGDNFGYRPESNGKFCVAVGPVIRTVLVVAAVNFPFSIVIWRWLTDISPILQNDYHTGLLYASLIGYNPRLAYRSKGMSSSQRTTRLMHKSSSILSTIVTAAMLEVIHRPTCVYQSDVRLRNDLYCVGWGVKLY